MILVIPFLGVLERGMVNTWKLIAFLISFTEKHFVGDG